MLSSPGNHIVGYTGRAVNFTWTFSNQTLIDDMHFGTWKKNDFENSIVYISQFENGTSTVDLKQHSAVLEYSGRIRWAGDVSIGLAIFELSGIKSSDERTYALDILYKNDDESELNSQTKLIVKVFN
ncbi:uncharacterized protein LOC116301620 [Actinia tenebrosa]|uniref:Uncharacterized protein LOC116301620 n=1 Tax=Actinia tenebrosa TaxID=6105 RepID=A0A6P8IID7_ACTTE|nr:uncharacterized protein LOC116301620 [Actinia tenebrosa]